MRFDRLVFWSGIWNFILGLVLVIPALTQLMGLHIPNPFWPWLVALLLWFTSAVLILCSGDVQRYASFAYWEAILRFTVVVVMIVYGFTYLGPLAAALIAVTEFAWGACYVVGLPRITNRTHAQLLLDRRD